MQFALTFFILRKGSADSVILGDRASGMRMD